MEHLRGRVDGLEHERRVVGRPRAGRPAAAVHFYRFELDGRRLELRHGAALPLNDGDEVEAVCGGRRSPLRVYAWRNHTWGATLVEPPGIAAAMRGWLPAIPAVVLMLAARALADAAGGHAMLVTAALAGVAGIASALLAVRGCAEYARYRRAARRLEGRRPASGESRA